MRQLGAEADNDDWNRVGMLLDTLNAEELFNTEADELIYRLFHEEAPRLFDPKELSFQCSCSLEKVENTLRSLGEQEANAIIEEQGKVEINCEFCNSQYVLDKVDVARLFNSATITPANNTVH